MRFSAGAKALVVQHCGSATDVVIRVLVRGGTREGFEMELIQDALREGDVQGTDGELSWVVDPVSWQFLEGALVDVKDGALVLAEGAQIGI